MDAVLGTGFLYLAGEINPDRPYRGVKTDSQAGTLSQLHLVKLIKGITDIVKGRQTPDRGEGFFDFQAAYDEMPAPDYLPGSILRTQRLIPVSPDALVSPGEKAEAGRKVYQGLILPGCAALAAEQKGKPLSQGNQGIPLKQELEKGAV